MVVRSKKLFFFSIFATSRSKNESLEPNLFAAQQHIPQLEISRSHLGAQGLTVTKVEMEGESLMYFVCGAPAAEAAEKAPLSAGLLSSDGAGGRALLH